MGLVERDRVRGLFGRLVDGCRWCPWRVLSTSGSEQDEACGEETKPFPKRRGPVERQYVAIDLHRRRSLIVRQNQAGEELGVVRIDNDPVALAMALADAGETPEVAIEATYGWYWAVDVLGEQGARVHLMHPSGLYGEDRRVNNDYRDCQELLDRMRLNGCPRPGSPLPSSASCES
jgi:hypothetical protein